MGCAPSEMEEFNAQQPGDTAGAVTRSSAKPTAAPARPALVPPGVHILTPHELALRQGRTSGGQLHAKCASSAALPSASPRSTDIDDLFGTLENVPEEQPFSGDAWQAAQKAKQQGAAASGAADPPVDLDAVSVSTGAGSGASTRSNSPSPGANSTGGGGHPVVCSDDLDSVFGVQEEAGAAAATPAAPPGSAAAAATAKELLEEAADIRARAEHAASRMLALVQLFPASADGSDPQAALHARLRAAAQVWGLCTQKRLPAAPPPRRSVGRALCTCAHPCIYCTCACACAFASCAFSHRVRVCLPGASQRHCPGGRRAGQCPGGQGPGAGAGHPWSPGHPSHPRGGRKQGGPGPSQLPGGGVRGAHEPEGRGGFPLCV
jgi:hypothetical protein